MMKRNNTYIKQKINVVSLSLYIAIGLGMLGLVYYGTTHSFDIRSRASDSKKILIGRANAGEACGNSVNTTCNTDLVCAPIMGIPDYGVCVQKNVWPPVNLSTGTKIQVPSVESCKWCGSDCISDTIRQGCPKTSPPRGYTCVYKDSHCMKVLGY